ncbi:hypothetical protein [Corynebacterium durum]|nr:hypothetical protein [Corynebacterium durum]
MNSYDFDTITVPGPDGQDILTVRCVYDACVKHFLATKKVGEEPSVP